jgi:hypothetical protein
MFARLVEGHEPEVDFEVNGRTSNKEYYLADDIYPQCSTLVKTIHDPFTVKAWFDKYQESCRKDVEWSFCVIQ